MAKEYEVPTEQMPGSLDQGRSRMNSCQQSFCLCELKRLERCVNEPKQILIQVVTYSHRKRET